MSSVFKPNTRKNDIVVQQLADETLVYDLKTNKAYCLNETSALVWQLCDGTRSISEISNELSAQLTTLISEDFVALAIDQFQRDGLLEDGSTRNDPFLGVSRRELIKKVGFSTIVALPLVSSIVAPEASWAQSMALLPNNTTCTAPGQCTSGNCFGGTTCCAAGVTGNNAPGFEAANPPGLFNCNTFAPNCCSGSATLVFVNPGGGGAFIPGCRCDV